MKNRFLGNFSLLRKIFIISFCVFSFFTSTLLLFAQEETSNNKPKAILFFSPTCHACTNVKTNILPAIEQKYAQKIDFEKRDLGDENNYKFLLQLTKDYNYTREVRVPIIFINKNFLLGEDEIKEKLEKEILIISPGDILPVKQGTKVDLLQIFKNFSILMILGAGLIDGINPCAFTVIVFFISFLSLQGYKKKELIIIGLTFIFSVFITYLVIGIGLFNFVYAISAFSLIRKIFNITIGVITFGFGCCAVYDLYRYKKTGQTEGLLLQLPKSIKNRIHAVIGNSYRKTQDNKKVVEKRGIFKLAIATFITGFLVSILEAVCTGQVYVPTIAFVLKSSPEKFLAIVYLVIYNLCFIIPLIIVFLLSLIGVTSGKFSEFLKKNMVLTKLAMAILFFSLAIYIIRS